MLKCEFEGHCEGQNKASHRCQICDDLYCEECAELEDYLCKCEIEENIVELPEFALQQESKK